jgi:hypothetical protein
MFETRLETRIDDANFVISIKDLDGCIAVDLTKFFGTNSYSRRKIFENSTDAVDYYNEIATKMSYLMINKTPLEKIYNEIN